MAGAACKVIINGGVKALTDSIERILIDPNVHQNRMSDAVREKLIQQLADNDLAAYRGSCAVTGGLVEILLELERLRLVTEEVWEVYKRPDLLPSQD